MASSHWWQPGVSLTIYEVAELEASSPVVSELSRPWRLDLSCVEAIDGAGLQWLLSLQARAVHVGGDVSLEALSDVVDGALRVAGGHQWFSKTPGRARVGEGA